MHYALYATTLDCGVLARHCQVPPPPKNTLPQVSTEVRTLDSDMQMLIYENYNQFIAALDAIKGIRSKTQSMEDGMHELQQRIGACIGGCVLTVVYWWLCIGGCVLVVVYLWWCICGGVLTVVYWCFSTPTPPTPPTTTPTTHRCICPGQSLSQHHIAAQTS